jgi:hypothetical protein
VSEPEDDDRDEATDPGERKALVPEPRGFYLRAPPLSLLDEEGFDEGETHRLDWRRESSETGYYDAWTVDRVRRSSLPPSSSAALMPLVVSPTPLPSAATLNRSTHDGDALSLVERSQDAPHADLMNEMADRFALGDFSGSLRAAEFVLGQLANDETALHYARESRTKLEALYASRLVAGGRVPIVAIKETDVRWLGLDARVSSLLARVDGERDLEALVATSGMTRLDALKALVGLLEAKVIRLM